MKIKIVGENEYENKKSVREVKTVKGFDINLLNVNIAIIYFLSK